MIAKERMYTNAAQNKLVPERSKEVAFLYAAVGTEIPESAVKRFGIKDGRKFTKEPKAPSKKAGAGKAKTPKSDKAKKPAANKGKGGLMITPLPDDHFDDTDKES